jgi:hypothetical protein
VKISWRPATKQDRILLNGFTCTEEDGPEYEKLVQRYFRAASIRNMGTPTSLRRDHRLLLVFDAGHLVDAGCHERRVRGERLFAFGAVATEFQPRDATLTNGLRASDALWQVVSNDIFDRERAETVTVVARVHPENRRSLRFCEWIGLVVREPEPDGLVVCAGLVGGSPG